MLLDLGAEVIKIEPPATDFSRMAYPRNEAVSGYYAQQNIGKRNISFNLNVAGAREIALRLCDQADTIVENFRPGTMAAFGLDYDSIRKRNPRVVYASITGLMRDSRFLTLELRKRNLAELHDMVPGIPAVNCGMILNGVCHIPNVKVDTYLMATNTPRVVTYRGASRPEATYLIETMVDQLARKLGMDPAEVRRRNFIQPEQFPYTTPIHAFSYDSGDYPGNLKKALEIVGYERQRAEQKKLRETGRYIGSVWPPTPSLPELAAASFSTMSSTTHLPARLSTREQMD